MKKSFTRARIAYRQAGTAFVFFLISAGGLFMSLFIFPVIGLLSSSTRLKHLRVQKCLHYTLRLVTFIMKILCLVKLKKINWQKIETDQAQLIIANHPSLIDYVYLVSLFPQMDCVVKKELWNNFFLKGVVQSAGYIKVENPYQFKEDCLKALEDGRTLLIFPEGTRSGKDSLRPFKKGAASLIASSTCKVQILIIKCTPPVLMKNRKWYDIPPKTVELSIEAREPLDRNKASGQESSKVKAKANINDYLWKYINSCL